MEVDKECLKRPTKEGKRYELTCRYCKAAFTYKRERTYCDKCEQGLIAGTIKYVNPNRKKNRGIKGPRVQEAKRKKKQGLTLAQLNTAARALGLTYGQYVAQNG